MMTNGAGRLVFDSMNQRQICTFAPNVTHHTLPLGYNMISLRYIVRVSLPTIMKEHYKC